jgi:hypothetical protein
MFQEITQESHPFDYNIDAKYNYNYSKNLPSNIYNISTNIDYYEFYKQSKCINLYGSISPHGPIIDTPNMIKLPLKLHQKRTVYEMMRLENEKQRLISKNYLILSDNVGSGKSYCILSLIANNQHTKLYNNVYNIRPEFNTKDEFLHHIEGVITSKDILEFNSNLIVVPHSIYTQWNNYISNYTIIPYIGLSNLLDMNKIGNNREQIIDKLNSIHIILIKSTIYNDFIQYLESYNIKQTVENIDVSIEYSSEQKDNEYNIITDDGKVSIELKTNIADRKTIINNIKKNTEELIDSLEKNRDIENMINKYTKNITDNINNYKNNYNDNNSNNIRYCGTLTYISGFIFQRIILDEADSIKIPSCKHFYGKITWLITSSFISLIYDKYTRVLDKDINKVVEISNGINGLALLKNDMRSICNKSYARENQFRIFSTIIRNHPEFVKISIDIPKPNVNYIKCLTPLCYNAIQNALGQDIIRALNAGDMNSASNLLGYEIHSENDIIDTVTKSLTNKKNETIRNINIKKHEHSLLEQELTTAQTDYNRVKELYKNTPVEIRPEEFHEIKKNYYSINGRLTNIEKTIQNYNNEVNNIESKIKNIIERLENPTAKTCPICMDNINVACISICCKNVYCLECIKSIIKHKKTCPLCRETLDNSKIHIIKDDEKDNITDDIVLLDKIDMVSNYLLSNSNKRILIFSEYERTFDLIEKRLTHLGIRHGRIVGNTIQINKIINEYKNNTIQVLMLNASFFGAGINLQMTDDIFVYHRMSPDLEKQVIGRAQRLGRIDPLNIHYLCYDNEYNLKDYNENIGINPNHIIEQ